MVTIKQAADMLLEMDDIAILIHQNPDGDALGSGYGLCLCLQQLGKRAKVLCSDEIPARYDFLLTAKEQDFTPAHYVSVDVADPKLLGSLEELAQKVELCIDHHATNREYAALTLCDSNAAAAAQIVFDVCKQMGAKITPDIANCFYTGISTDTGCFKYQNVTSETMRKAADLIDLKADFATINRLMFDTKSQTRLTAEASVISGMEYYGDGKIAVAVITLDLIKSLNLNALDFDGISALPRTVEGVEIGITLRQRAESEFKISCRSSVYADVSEMCSKLGGGGHKRAAGCQLTGDLETVKQTIVQLAKQYI